MSAGQSIDHNIQDDAEIYFVYLLQSISEKRGIAHTNSSTEMLKELVSMLKYHKLTDKKFYGSVYAANAKLATESFFDALVKNYPSAKTFDFRCVETEFRNKSMKGDFVIIIDKNEEISVSLKNYKKPLGDIQTCSGTWNSFLINFLLDSVGPGNYVNPINGEVVNSRKAETIYEILNELGYTKVVDALMTIKNLNGHIRNKYLNDDKYLMWNDTKNEWKRDCEVLSLQAIDVTLGALQSIPQDVLKKRMLKSSGLDGKEELLMIGKHGTWMCSITNESYKNLLRKVRESELVFEKVGKSIRFYFQTKSQEILSIDVPFTLQKNGAWYCPKEIYEGRQLKENEDVKLLWGERRPKKSRELSTSINSWVRLKNAV